MPSICISAFFYFEALLGQSQNDNVQAQQKLDSRQIAIFNHVINYFHSN